MGEKDGLTRVDGGRGRVGDHHCGGKDYASAKFEHFHGVFHFVLVLEITLSGVPAKDRTPFFAQPKMR
jgi:hypothetical protein